MAEDKAKAEKSRAVPRMQVSGMIKVIDKDGNLKAELPITSIDVNAEEETDATEHDR